MPLSSPTYGPVTFQRVMVFIDGTNLFHRLEAARMRLTDGALARMCEYHSGGRQIIRTLLYTSEPHFVKAQSVHGQHFAKGMRVVLGDAVPTSSGNFKEKGVDALLVADLVYHAAAKNFDHAILISVDTDFAHALTRVEDFGCRTAVVAVCSPLPERLQRAADEMFFVDDKLLLSQHWAAPV